MRALEERRAHRNLGRAAAFFTLLLPALGYAGAEQLEVFCPGVRDDRDTAVPALRALLEGQGRITHEAAWSTEALARSDVILLAPQSADWLEGAGEDVVESISRAVASGKGLVVWGKAAQACQSSRPFAELLGRAMPASDAAPGREVTGLALLVRDQSHAITQCINHLVLERAVLASASPAAKSAREALAHAAERAQPSRASPAAPEPVLWTARPGRGRVAVLRLDVPSSSKPGREEAAVSLLLARAVQWSADRQVTVKIPSEMPLFAERVDVKDEARYASFPEAAGYFRGREIAPVMGFQGADWLERRDRESTEEPDKVVESLDIAEGATAADVGAGTGYFTFRLARKVGPRGRVFATDIQSEMLELLKARKEELKAANVIPVLAREAETGLPAGEVDLILMVDVYHELSRPAESLEALRKSLRTASEGRKAGRLVLVEYRGEDPLVPIKPLHRTTVQQIRAELEPRGFKLLEVKEFLLHQHVLVFERRS